LLAQHLVLGAIEAATAILLRPVRHGPALVAHALEPDALRFRREFCVTAAPEHVGIGGGGLAHFRRAVRLQPGARLLAKLFEIGHRRFHLNDRLESTLVTASRNSISLQARHAFGAVARARNRVYSEAITIEKQEETVMRLKLLSPGEMSAEQKETYDESI